MHSDCHATITITHLQVNLTLQSPSHSRCCSAQHAWYEGAVWDFFFKPSVAVVILTQCSNLSEPQFLSVTWKQWNVVWSELSELTYRGCSRVCSSPVLSREAPNGSTWPTFPSRLSASSRHLVLFFIWIMYNTCGAKKNYSFCKVFMRLPTVTR